LKECFPGDVADLSQAIAEVCFPAIVEVSGIVRPEGSRGAACGESQEARTSPTGVLFARVDQFDVLLEQRVHQ
jgi:hypothetical protein